MADPEFRPPTESDIPRLVELRRAAETEDGIEPVACPADYTMLWGKPTFSRERHSIVAWLDGTIVAAADLYMRETDAVSFGHVDAAWRGRGIGSRLLDRVIAAARGEPELRELYVSVPARPDALALMDSRPEFTYARTFFTMLNRNPAALPEPEWPAGIRLVDLEGDALVDAVIEAHAGSFIDHWNYHPMERSMVEAWLTHPDEDPSLWFIAFDGDRVAGFCICHYETAPSGRRGWVGSLGTGRPWRRIGLGRALLRHACCVFVQRGMSIVGLNVDASGSSGALGFYERSGFETVVEERRFSTRIRD